MTEPQIFTNEKGDVAVARYANERARAAKHAQQDREDGIADDELAEADPPDALAHARMMARLDGDMDPVDAELEADDERRENLRVELEAVRVCEEALIAVNASGRDRVLRWLIDAQGSRVLRAQLP